MTRAFGAFPTIVCSTPFNEARSPSSFWLISSPWLRQPDHPGDPGVVASDADGDQAGVGAEPADLRRLAVLATQHVAGPRPGAGPERHPVRELEVLGDEPRVRLRRAMAGVGRRGVGGDRVRALTG